MYYKLCREYTLHSLNTIGKSVGKNHASVLHGVKLFDNWIDKHEKSYIDTYSRLDKIIASKLNRERKYRDKEYYRNKYAKTLIKLKYSRIIIDYISLIVFSITSHFPLL